MLTIQIPRFTVQQLSEKPLHRHCFFEFEAVGPTALGGIIAVTMAGTSLEEARKEMNYALVRVSDYVYTCIHACIQTYLHAYSTAIPQC